MLEVVDRPQIPQKCAVYWKPLQCSIKLWIGKFSLWLFGPLRLLRWLNSSVRFFRSCHGARVLSRWYRIESCRELLNGDDVFWPRLFFAQRVVHAAQETRGKVLVFLSLKPSNTWNKSPIGGTSRQVGGVFWFVWSFTAIALWEPRATLQLMSLHCDPGALQGSPTLSIPQCQIVYPVKPTDERCRYHWEKGWGGVSPIRPIFRPRYI